MRKPFAFMVFVWVTWAAAALAQRPLTFEDLMRFRQVHDATISDDGAWIAYAAVPDRGDGDGIVRSTRGKTEYRVPCGAQPVIGKDDAFVAMKLEVGFEHRERKGESGGDEKQKPGMALLRTRDGTVETFERVQSFALTKDGAWLAVHEFAPEKEEEPCDRAKDEKDAKDEEKKAREPGSTLRLRRLATGEEMEFPLVTSYAFDETSHYLALATASESGEENAFQLHQLGGDTQTLDARPNAAYPQMKWAKDVARLAFLAGLEETRGPITDVALHVWEPSGERVVASVEDAPEGWEIPAENTLVFSDDARRLFFGFKPAAPREEKPDPEQEAAPFDPTDREALLDQVSLDVWQWNDPRIKSNDRTRWKDEKKRTYRAVVHLDAGSVVPLAGEDLPDVEVSRNPDVALASSDVPYLQEITWDGSYRDLYVVDLKDGHRRRLATHLQFTSSLSPGGRYVVFYDDEAWHLAETATGRIRNLTADLDVPFADEDHDYPMDRPGYGLGGWVEDDAAVLIYDKYDVWRFPTDGGAPTCLTGGRGRDEKTQYRVVDLDPDDPYVEDDLLLSAYREATKNDAFFAGRIDAVELKPLREEEKRFHFLARAKNADALLYSEESYEEFPDLWVSDRTFHKPRKVSDVNPQIHDFAWGTAELVHFSSADGIPLDGVLIKPSDYQEGERYPVLVYFYRFMSQRLHEFNEPVVNHRPSFPMYASHGYCVFLPDVRFEVGRPGMSAVKCLVPGVQKLIDMGVADPKGIGLHGHSWSGYQAAYVITATHIFAACAAGAPVANMTSSYSGIRLESGLARQFQYEKSQSRIGASLWEARDLYIENSPVFFADRITTPLLIEHGDEDEAVPWQQGVEMYLAMRRLHEPCVLLAYRGEGHHLKKYPNKLDYSIKMMEFFDHFCKGAPAPSWWTDGVAFEGED